MTSLTGTPAKTIALSGSANSPSTSIFDLRDDYTSTRGVSTTPRLCVPGPGTTYFIQTDGTLTVGSNVLTFTAQSTPVWGDLGFYGDAQTRATGLMLVAQMALTTWEECGIGWHTAAAVIDPDSAEHAIQFNTTNGRLDDEGGISLVTGLVATDEIQLFLILRSAGAYLVKSDGTNYRMLRLARAGSSATLYPIFSNLDAAGKIGSARVVQLAAPWTTDNGIATSTLTPTHVAAQTYTHTANTLISFVMDTVPAGGNHIVSFRKQDANNYWYLRITGGTGAARIYTREGGVDTLRANISGAGNAGDVLEVKIEDDVATFYRNGASKTPSYTSALFASETDGAIENLGTTGASSDLVALPITPSAAAIAAIEAGLVSMPDLS